MRRIGDISVETATPSSQVLDNVRASLKRPYPYLEDMEWFGKKTGPIALVGGGPSLSCTIDDLVGHSTVMACGSAHDYVVTEFGTPDYCVVADPDPDITALYLRWPRRGTTYLVSTACPESVFEALHGQKIVLWHCHGEGYEEMLARESTRVCLAIGGGCTTGLRALSISLCMGYRDIHFYGFDSCHDGGNHHAYQFAGDEQLDKLYRIRIGFGTPGEKTYVCEGYQLAQAMNFRDFVLANPPFKATFHGGGLMADVWSQLSAKINPSVSDDPQLIIG